MAQLIQFTSVVIYTVCTAYLHYYNVPHEAIEGVQPSLRTYYTCCLVQVFEMVSLFILFSLFFQKKYSSSKKSGGKKMLKKSTSSMSVKDDADQCQKAMGEISTAAKDAAQVAAKNVKVATQAVKRTNAVGGSERDRFC